MNPGILVPAGPGQQMRLQYVCKLLYCRILLHKKVTQLKIRPHSPSLKFVDLTPAIYSSGQFYIRKSYSERYDPFHYKNCLPKVKAGFEY